MSSLVHAARTLLLTGKPGVGKTTLIRAVAAALADRTVRGFITDEIRNEGQRVGFRLETIDGQHAILAHADIRSPHRVGKYGVDVKALDRIAQGALRPDDGIDVYLIDEIGRMECLSERFRAAVAGLLDSGCTVVATIHRNAPGFVQRVKERRDVELWEVTHQNRDGLPQSILAWLERRRKPGRSVLG